MSLFIPHVFNYISSERIQHVVETYLGKVSRIDIVSKSTMDGNYYNSAYIHMSQWYDTQTVANFQESIKNPDKQSKLIYNEPYYWIILENTSKNMKPNPLKRKLTLDLECCDTKSYNEEDTYKEQDTTLQKNMNPPIAPRKQKTQQMTNNDFSKLYNTKKILFPSFDSDQQKENFMNKIEELIAEDEIHECEEDKYLVSVDSRYIQSLEQNVKDLSETASMWYSEACHYFGLVGLYKNNCVTQQMNNNQNNVMRNHMENMV